MVYSVDEVQMRCRRSFIHAEIQSTDRSLNTATRGHPRGSSIHLVADLVLYEWTDVKSKTSSKRLLARARGLEA